MSVSAFFDTNVLIYAVAQNDARAAIAQGLLSAGGRVSVQVLNEFASVARKKLNYAWPDIRVALAAVRRLCPDPVDLGVGVHDRAVVLAERHSLSFYDALIVAAAQQARCDVLYSEDMQHGHVFDGALRIENPFKP
jgi:predicted nucleic acid-binding protein